MAEKTINALGRSAAYQLANVTKTAPQFGSITPNWLTRVLEPGIYRVNRVVAGETPLDVLCGQGPKKVEIPQGFVGYASKLREYQLGSISTIINCAQPVHRFFGLEGAVRPSIAFYNTPDGIDKLVAVMGGLV